MWFSGLRIHCVTIVAWITAVAWVQSLAWEFPYAIGIAKKTNKNHTHTKPKNKTKQNKLNKSRKDIYLFHFVLKK